MSIIHTINPDYNFWDLYPELKKVEEFQYIQKEYKSKSSDVMWFIAACFDMDSKFINMDITERSNVLSKDYLKDKNWFKLNEKKIEPAIQVYTTLTDTPARRHLRQWNLTMDKRTQFLKESEYDLDNYDKLDRMAVGTDKLFATFKKIQEDLNKEKGAGATKGGHELSLADSEDI